MQLLLQMRRPPCRCGAGLIYDSPVAGSQATYTYAELQTQIGVLHQCCAVLLLQKVTVW
jgi:hypothetical protein